MADLEEVKGKLFGEEKGRGTGGKMIKGWSGLTGKGHACMHTEEGGDANAGLLQSGNENIKATVLNCGQLGFRGKSNERGNGRRRRSTLTDSFSICTDGDVLLLGLIQ